MALSFAFVNNCKPGDLLRVKIEDTAEFAILGANEGHGLPALVALKDNEPPFAINLLESGRIDGDFETYAALVYGKCEILPDDTDRCEIGIGPLFTKVGSLDGLPRGVAQDRRSSQTYRSERVAGSCAFSIGKPCVPRPCTANS